MRSLINKFISFNVSKRLNNKNSRLGKVLNKGDLNVSKIISIDIMEMIKTKI